MAQSDQIVQNGTFPTVRADINDNLAALFSQSSGPSAPATTVAFQPWVDTSSTPAVWKVRNASNNAWITVGVLDPAGFRTGGVTPIANGGTGATTAAAALAALLPSQTGQAGKGLTTDGTVASWGTIAAGASIQVFTSSGTYTPTLGKTTFLVFVTGGAGAGGGGNTVSGVVLFGGGGGAGGTAIGLFTPTTLGATASITIGAGATVQAGSGGSSSFTPANGSTPALVGVGGLGGTSASNSSNGTAGTGGGTTNSLLNIKGMDAFERAPGTSFWGSIGAGGIGGRGSGSSGSAGTNGVCLILEW